MGLLRKLFGGDAPRPTSNDRPPSWMVEGVRVTLLEGGRESLECVGESFYLDNLRLLVGALTGRGHFDSGERVKVPVDAILVADRGNPHDANAVSVWVNGRKVAHLSRQDAATYRPGLLALERKEGRHIALEGVIVGRDGLYGVWLNVDPEDFGVKSTSVPGTAPRETVPRSGLSDAFRTDEEDESYDLSWMGRLPDDTAKRIPQLRKLLEDDPDPIDRHFMFRMLEEDLYACRDLWESALDEYDEVAERHHLELEAGMRSALFEKFGAIPLIETYRQAAIRNQKARRWDKSLEWAERGLTIYASDAVSQEWVEDLEERAERARAKLNQPAEKSGGPTVPGGPRTTT